MMTLGRNSLRVAMGGTNAPMTAQYVHLLLTMLPRSIARHPRSAAFRRAAHIYILRHAGLPLEPTRRDIETGLEFLAKNGLLPCWVVYDSAHQRTPHA